MAALFDEKLHYSIARAGYAGRGVLYLIIGGFAVAAAVGSGAETVDTAGAMQALLSQPFGIAMLGLVAACLFIYAFWRVFQVALDPDEHGFGFPGIFVRLGLLFSAIGYGGLGLVAVDFLSNSAKRDRSHNTIEGLLLYPYGQLLVWLVAAIIAIVGIAHCFKGFRAGFEKRFRDEQKPPPMLIYICQFGLVMRGFAYVVIAVLFALAAYQDESRKAGLSQAMDTIREQPFGPLLFAVLALGLFCYGVYSLAEVWYRKMDG